MKKKIIILPVLLTLLSGAQGYPYNNDSRIQEKEEAKTNEQSTYDFLLLQKNNCKKAANEATVQTQNISVSTLADGNDLVLKFLMSKELSNSILESNETKVMVYFGYVYGEDKITAQTIREKGKAVEFDLTKGEDIRLRLIGKNTKAYSCYSFQGVLSYRQNEEEHLSNTNAISYKPKEYSKIEFGNKSTVIGNPGKWYYCVDGKNGTDYKFIYNPSLYDDTPHIAFSKTNGTKTHQLRYQPKGNIGDHYIIQFKAIVRDGYIIHNKKNIRPDEKNIIEFHYFGIINSNEPFFIDLKADNEGEGMSIDFIEYSVSDTEDSYEITKAQNSSVLSNPGVWHYWAEGKYQLADTPYKVKDKMYFRFDSLQEKQTYQLRYQPTGAIGSEFDVIMKVKLSADGTVLYGKDNKSVSVKAGEEKNVSYHGTIGADKPFMIQIKPLSYEIPISLTVSDFTISDVRLQDYEIQYGLNKEVIANPGKWYYYSNGKKENGDYAFKTTPKRYTNNDVVLSMSKETKGKEVILRYQPVLPVGSQYRVRFKVRTDKEANLSYGLKSSGNSVALKPNEQIECTSSKAIEVKSDSVFELNLKPSDYSSEITMTISDFEVREVSEAETISAKYADLFDIGAAVKPSSLKTYDSLMKNFSSLTPEYSMKWKFLEATKGKKDYSAMDEIIRYSKEYKKKVRGHTLVWFKSLPEWVKEEATTKENALKLISNHIEETMTHFQDDIYCYDVVNEALRNSITEDQLNQNDIYRTGDDEIAKDQNAVDWYKICGIDYIKTAFKSAMEVKKKQKLNTKLYYNDYSLANPNKREACIKLVNELKKDSIEIDGIGMQTHCRIKDYIGKETSFLNDFENAIIAYTGLGLDVQITELDIDISSGYLDDSDINTRKAKQKELYESLFRICRKYALPAKGGNGSVTNISTWGIADTSDSSADSKLMFDSELKEKALVTSIKDF